MIKPCNALTPNERAAILRAIKAGRVFWPYRNASDNGTLTLQDIEAHGQFDSSRGVLILGGLEMKIEIEIKLGVCVAPASQSTVEGSKA